MALVALLALLACRGEPTLTPAQVLTRASLDLRGVRPTDAELLAANNAEDLNTQLDAWLYDDRLGDRLIDLFAPVYRTRVEQFLVGVPTGRVDDLPSFYRAVGEEPLRLLAEVAISDLPWTTLVTADWSMGDERLAQLFPIDYPSGARGWRRVRYLDGRPAAGVLTTNGLWWRYTSTIVNASRGRANAASRILLCDDLLARDVAADFDIDLLDEESLQRALREQPSCTSCHAALDPLAGFFFGFFNYNLENSFEAERYHPDRELLWREMLGLEPAYFGVRAEGLAGLGALIAADPRFVGCAVEQTFELLLRREVTLADTDALSEHRAAFEAGDLRLRALLASLLRDPRYRGELPDAAGGVSRKLVSADLLASQIEDLTGFRWMEDGVDRMDSATTGFAELAGEADGRLVTEPATVPGTTLVLVQQRLAEAAAAFAIERERTMSAAERRLFTEVNLDNEPPEDTVRAQLALLRLRVLGQAEDPEGELITEDLALWRDLLQSEGSPDLAWQGVLILHLRSPDFILY